MYTNDDKKLYLPAEFGDDGVGETAKHTNTIVYNG